MRKRLLGVLYIALFAVFPVLYGSWAIKLLVSFMGIAGIYEFYKLKSENFSFRMFLLSLAFVMLLLYFPCYQLLFLFGLIFFFFYIAIINPKITIQDIAVFFLNTIILGYGLLSILKVYEIGNSFLMIFIMFACFGCDIGAYIFGRFFGKTKLNVRISPKKTIEGAIGGYLTGVVLGFVFAYFHDYVSIGLFNVLVSCLVLPFVGQVGDLAFSLIKRTYKIKDFSNIIPGHGGVLDRIDSLLFCLLFMGAFLG